MRISLYGIVDESMSRKVAELLDAVPAGTEKIDLRVNTPGGKVTEGFAIYNRLKESGLAITATVEGMAASIGATFLAAAAKVRIAKNARVMIHKPLVRNGGNADDLRLNAEGLDRLQDQYEDALASKAKLSRPHLREAINAGTWYTAEQAITAGFADELIDTPAIPLAAVACADLGYEVPDFALDLFGLAEEPQTERGIVSDTKQPEAQAGTNLSTELLSQYCQEFGKDNGVEWAIAGKPLVDCYKDSLALVKESHDAELSALKKSHEAELAAVKAEVEALTEKNKQLKDAVAISGEAEAVAVAGEGQEAKSMSAYEAAFSNRFRKN